MKIDIEFARRDDCLDQMVPSDLRVLVSERDELRAELAALKAGQGDPILVEAVAVTKENEDGELYLDWLLEGGISALEFPGTTLLVAHGKVTDDTGSGEVYTAPPATDVVVPPELLERTIERLRDGGVRIGQRHTEDEELRALLARQEVKS